MRSLERKGSWPQSRVKPIHLPNFCSDGSLRLQRAMLSRDPPHPNQGGDWTQQNMQGPQVSPQLLL